MKTAWEMTPEEREALWAKNDAERAERQSALAKLESYKLYQRWYAIEALLDNANLREDAYNDLFREQSDISSVLHDRGLLVDDSFEDARGFGLCKEDW